MSKHFNVSIFFILHVSSIVCSDKLNELLVLNTMHYNLQTTDIDAFTTFLKGVILLKLDLLLPFSSGVQALCEDLTRKAADLAWENESLKRVGNSSPIISIFL